MENEPFIGDLPIQIVIFHSYVSLPEGVCIYIYNTSFVIAKSDLRPEHLELHQTLLMAPARQIADLHDHVLQGIRSL